MAKRSHWFGFSSRVRYGSMLGASLSAIMLATMPGHAAAAVIEPDAAPTVLAAEPAVAFSIPAGPLSEALAALGRQARMQISYDPVIVRGLTTDGLTGRYAPGDALRRLLSGTGILWRTTDERSVVLTRAAKGESGALTLDPVRVEGSAVPRQAEIGNLPPAYAGGQVATGSKLGLLGNRDVMDTPFNQTSYTATKAQDQQAMTIRDVLLDDPSVRFSLSDAATGYEAARIRGFYALPSGVAYGGLFDMLGDDSVMVELAERVEVLKGPNAMLNGMTPIGGAINIVPKRAPEEDLNQLTATYASLDQLGVHADVARRFGPDKAFGVRFNGVFRDGETPVDFNKNQRGLAVLGLDYRGERVRLSTDLGYQHQDVDGSIASIGVAAGVPVPEAPDASINSGQPWNNINRQDIFGIARAEVDLAENITVFAAAGAHDFRSSSYVVWGVRTDNVDGDATASAENYIYKNRYLTGEVGLRALLGTGPIHHELVGTATALNQVSRNGWVIGPQFATNIYNPTVVARPDIATPETPKVSDSTMSGLAFADTLSVLDNRVQLTLGARLQRVQADNFDRTTGEKTSSYDQSALSPSVGLVVKPWQNVSVYGNYIQGLQQGTTVGSTYANAGEVFPPYETEQYEAGVKVDWGRFTTTASLFQITQPSVISVPGTPLPTLSLDGEQRNRGVELNAFGEPMAGVRLLGGAMLLDAELTKTQNVEANGWTAPFSPAVNLNLGGEWDLPFMRGLTLIGRVVYTGSQYIDTTSPRRTLPDWTRFDLGARYTFDNPLSAGRSLVARFNVDNVVDSSYWEGGNSASVLNRGMPRTFRLSLTADF